MCFSRSPSRTLSRPARPVVAAVVAGVQVGAGLGVAVEAVLIREVGGGADDGAVIVDAQLGLRPARCGAEVSVALDTYV
jgi:hypothetical protein